MLKNIFGCNNHDSELLEIFYALSSYWAALSLNSQYMILRVDETFFWKFCFHNFVASFLAMLTLLSTRDENS